MNGGKPAALLMLAKVRPKTNAPPPAQNEGMKVVARELASALGLPGADIARVAKALRAAARVTMMHESDEEARAKSGEA